MERFEGKRITGRLVVGCFFVAVGALLMLNQLHVSGPAELWPLIFVAVGAARMFEDRWGSATALMLLGAWFLACENGWWGCDYHDSWPLVIVAVGVGIVVRALRGEDGRGRRPVGGAA